MSLFSALSESPAPGVAVEIAASQVAAASLDWRGGSPVVAAHGIEPLPEGSIVPSLLTSNLHDRASVAAALGRVLEKV